MDRSAQPFEFPSFGTEAEIPSYHLKPEKIHLPELDEPEEPPPFTARKAFIPGSQVRLVEESLPDTAPPESSRPTPPSPELIRVSAEALKLRLQHRWKRVREQQWEAQLAEARKQGFEEGYRQAQRELEQKIEQTLALFMEGWTALQKQYTSRLNELEEMFLRMTFTLVERILNTPLPPAWAATLRQLLIQTIEEVAAQAPATIHLASTDYLAMQEAGIVEQLHQQHPSLRWMPTAELNPGEWVVESPTEVISREFNRLLHTLQEELGWSTDTDEEGTV